MSNLQNSPLLQQLIEKAKSMDKANPVNQICTVERFVMAVIDLLNTELPGDNAEWSQLDEILRKEVSDRDLFSQRLHELVTSEEQSTFLDDLYMKKRLIEAEQQAMRNHEQEISAAAVLSCILNNPTTALCTAMTPQQKQEQEMQSRQEAVRKLLEQMRQEKAQTEQAEAAQAAPEAEPEPKPKEKVSELVEHVRQVRQKLRAEVFGQDKAINVFTTGYFQANLLSMIDRSRKRPRATFLFAGPPGVGKTFLAETAAKVLQLPFKRFDMSEYADKEAHLEFCGTDGVYKGAKPGNVTDFVAKNPKCVLLFDEIEKAHMCVIHLFLQLLDAGRLRDNHTDNEVSFKDAIVILTTNAGRPLYEHSESGDFSSVSRKVIVKALQKDRNPATGLPFFPEALCSRFASGNVIMFNHISANSLCGIARKEIERHAENLLSETGIRLELESGVYTALLFSEGSTVDARTIRSRSEAFFNDELYELLRMIASEKAASDIADVEQIRVAVDLSGTAEEIQTLFRGEKEAKVLVFAEPDVIQVCTDTAQGVQIIGTQSLPEAADLLKKGQIAFALVDLHCGCASDVPRNLNVEDTQSVARDVLRLLREQYYALPVYLLLRDRQTISEEEMVSFLSNGIRDVLPVQPAEEFGGQIAGIAAGLHQQASMKRLARENKLVTFSTAQTVSDQGKCAQIRLFDFRQAVAVDPEDTENVLSAVSKPDVRFEDVIGAKEAKKELSFFINYLKDPLQFAGTGLKAPRGVLLYGPPGTGKTMLAKAAACEAGVTFIAAEGNQFLRKYVGEGPEKVHELFRTARKYAPAILFVDEIDAIAKERRGADGGSAGVEATLTAFLTEMDGFANDPTRPVFVLAATNFDVQPGGAKSLDPALMRRFDRRVCIDLPDRSDRARFLLRKKEKNAALCVSDQQIDNIAMRAAGMSLADLDSAVELALRSAVREGSKQVTDAILEEAFETYQGGETKIWNPSQLERVARHEAGHAFLCWRSGEKPAYLTIVARGDHGGYMQRESQEDKQIFTREELLGRIRTSLGGRAAEIVYYGPQEGVSTGASGDLRAATGLAKRMICAYGMDDTFGLAVVDGDEEENLAQDIRIVVNKTLERQLQQAIAEIRDHRPVVDALVEALLQKNALTADEIQSILEKHSR